MKRNLLLIGLLILTTNIFAQDTLLNYNRWQDFFKDYTKEQYALLQYPEDFNKKFQFDKEYNCFVVFLDSTKAPVEFKMAFNGVEKLSDARAHLIGVGYKEGYYDIQKKEVKFFVYNDIPFIHEYIRKAHKPKHWLDDWSMVLIDGLVRFTASVNIVASSSGKPPMLFLQGTVQKDEANIASELRIVGGFNFKKWAATSFSDYPELVAKIEAGEAGHTKNDALNIVNEYNEWVRKNDPVKFKKSMIFGSVIKGSM